MSAAPQTRLREQRDGCRAAGRWRQSAGQPICAPPVARGQRSWQVSGVTSRLLSWRGRAKPDEEEEGKVHKACACGGWSACFSPHRNQGGVAAQPLRSALPLAFDSQGAPSVGRRWRCARSLAMLMPQRASLARSQTSDLLTQGGSWSICWKQLVPNDKDLKTNMQPNAAWPSSSAAWPADGTHCLARHKSGSSKAPPP